MKAKAKKPKKIRMKTKKTFAKRIKVTGSGKLRRKHNYISHMAAHKSHKQKKHLSKTTIMDATEEKREKQLHKGE